MDNQNTIALTFDVCFTKVLNGTITEKEMEEKVLNKIQELYPIWLEYKIKRREFDAKTGKLIRTELI